MPTFRISTQTGTYKVTAPDEAAALRALEAMGGPAAPSAPDPNRPRGRSPFPGLRIDPSVGRPGLPRRVPAGEAYGKAAVYGAVPGLIMGGPVGAITGAAGGLAGEYASRAIEEGGGGGLAQFGGGLAADIGVSMLTRRPAAGLVRRMGLMGAQQAGAGALARGGRVSRFLGRGWAAEAADPATRAAASRISELPSPAAVGTPDLPIATPAEDLAAGVRGGYESLDDTYQAARRVAEQQNLDIAAPARPYVERAQQLYKELEGENFSDIPGAIRRGVDIDPSELFSIQRAENIRSSVGRQYGVGVAFPENKGHFTKVAGLYEPLEEILNDISARGGAAGVTAMKNMKAARAVMLDAVPYESRVYRELIRLGGIDNAQKAFDRILSGDRALEEVRRIKRLATNPAEQMALRRVAITHVLGRKTGQAAEDVASSPQTGGAALSKASDEAVALTEILGKRGYAQLKRLLRVAARSGRSDTPFSARMPSGRPGMANFLTTVAGLATGAGGGALGSEATALAGASAAAVGLFRTFRQMYGAEAVANLALTALTDPDIYRQVVAAGASTNASVLARRLGQALARRGLIEIQESGREEPQAVAR